MARHTLQQYQRHVEKFGPEMVLETAERELPEDQIEALGRFIQAQKMISKQTRIQEIRRRGERKGIR